MIITGHFLTQFYRLLEMRYYKLYNSLFESSPSPHVRYLFSMQDNRQVPTLNDSKWYFLFHYSLIGNTTESKSAFNSLQFLYWEMHKTVSYGNKNGDFMFFVRSEVPVPHKQKIITIYQLWISKSNLNTKKFNLYYTTFSL